MRLRLVTILAACMAVVAPSPAFALLCGALPLDPISVSATALAFGSFSGGSSATASATVSIACTIPVEVLPSFTISLSAGNSANGASRTMTGPGQLNYNIYSSSAYASVWSDGANGTVTRAFNGVLQLGTTTFTAYGRIPAGQYVPAGTYSDVLVVTVTY